MARLVSTVSVSLPFSASETLTMRKLQGKSAPGIHSRQKTSISATKLHAPICSSSCVFSADWSRHRHIMAFSTHFCVPVFSYLNILCSTHTIISGYWVGPDVEDGWGFVEAFVNRIL